MEIKWKDTSSDSRSVPVIKKDPRLFNMLRELIIPLFDQLDDLNFRVWVFKCDENRFGVVIELRNVRILEKVGCFSSLEEAMRAANDELVVILECLKTNIGQRTRLLGSIR